jgi:hypothetical protein
MPIALESLRTRGNAATQVGHRTPAELLMVRHSEGSARLGCGGGLLAGVAQLVFMLCSLGWFVQLAGYGGRCTRARTVA